MSGHLDIRLLGTFAVAVDGAILAPGAWRQRRAADLVKVLALAPSRRLPRDRVLEALWPHLAPQGAVTALHKAAHYARRALGGRDGVVLRGGLVALAPEADVTVDVARFEAGDDEAYAGELLPDDRYEAWACEERERLRALALARHRAAGRWNAVIALDPADEEAHRELMRAAARSGDRGGVARCFSRLRDELARLGIQPSPETTRLFRELSRGPAVAAPLGEQLAMTGRSAELSTVHACLDAAQAGRGTVLLLVGEGGSGKTSLAEAVLHAAGERRWHTLRASALDAAGDGSRVLEAAAATLRRQRPDLASPAGDAPADVPEVLAAAARERGCAVLLDDLHAADAAAAVLPALAETAACSRLVVVACWRPSDAGRRLGAVRDLLAARRLAREVALEPVAAGPRPVTRYAIAPDGARIAFQVVGGGERDVVLVPGFVSNVEHVWEVSAARRMLTRIAARSRLILWDRRGTGLSDPVMRAPRLDEGLRDLEAVLDAAGSRRAVLLGVSEGGAMSLFTAARRPERVAGLCLYGAAPRFLAAEDHPNGWRPEAARRHIERLFHHWGTGSLVDVFAPSRAGDPASREVFGRFQRAGASPAMGRAMAEAMVDIDVRELLPSIRTPTLVLHRTGDRLVHPDGGRMIAARVPGASFVELPGEDHFPFLGDVDDVADEVEAFLDGAAATV